MAIHSGPSKSADAVSTQPISDPFRLLVESVTDVALFMVDRVGVVASWNPGAERILGYAAVEAVGGSFSRFFPAADAAAGGPQFMLQRALAESRLQQDVYLRRKDGTLFWAVATVSASFDDIHHVGFAMMLRGAAETRGPESPQRVAVEAALQACEARYRTLFEYAQVGVVLADAESNYIDANPSACRMLGYSRAELIGLHATDIVVPTEAARIDEALNEINGRSDHRREWQFRRKDGSVFSADVVATLMPDGALLGLIRDLSDYKQVHDFREHLAAIVESSQDGIIGTDLDDIVTTWNSGAAAIYGYTTDEMIGQSMSRVIPEEVQPLEQSLLEKLRRGERTELLETVRRTKDGRLIDVAVVASPIRQADGRIVGASRIVRDVSTLKERQRELARLSRLYAALSHVNQAIIWSTTQDDLFQRVCRALVDHGGFHMVWIGWHDPATHRLVPVAECGDENDYLRSIQIYADDRPEGRGPSGTAFRSGQPYISNDPHRDPATAPWRSEYRRRGYRASAAFPLRLAGKVSGVLNVYSQQQDFFHDKEIALLVEAAANVSFALDNFERETARRQAEQTLRDAKQFTDTMIESMPGILYFYDAHGRFLRWNKNFEIVSGYSSEEIRRMHPLDFFAGDEKVRVQQRIAEVFERGESDVEAAFVAKNGTTLPFFFTGRRVLYEGQNCLVGVGIDISDRHRAELLLAESERKYRELVEHANSIILRWNTEGRVTFLNAYGQRFFGFAADEILGRQVLGTIVPPSESGGRDLQRLMEDICAAPEAFEQNINENMRRNGERVWIAWTNRVERNAEGKVVGILSIGADITERRLAEAEREKRFRAEAADRIKSAFLATMSHELRTPLNSIIGFTGILLQGLAGPLNAEQSKQLEMVRTSARHLLALVNDVLDISKIEAGQLDVAHEPFDLCRSINKVLGLIKPQAQTKCLELRVQIAPDLGQAVGDERRFEQILLNLLSNAIKFTERGAVELTAVRVADFKLARQAIGQPVVHLRVSDTGMGIKPEDLPTLFQPFRQIDSGLTRRHDGTGLGLAICRRLAALMGGEIHAESQWGHGSVFSVTLPLVGPVPS